MGEHASLAIAGKAAKSERLADKGKSQPKPSKTERKKRRYFRWKGCLADRNTAARLLVALILAVAGISFTFTQIGFVSFPAGDDEVAYAVVLLQPIALAALLLGTLFGALIGLICGVALLYHSMWMPLDVYEFSFVNPLTSVIMLTATGFIMSLLFAFVLRNDPSSVRRGFYIVIVCVIVSSLYSIGFSVNVFASLINDLTQGLQGGMTEDEVVQIATEGARFSARPCCRYAAHVSRDVCRKLRVDYHRRAQCVLE